MKILDQLNMLPQKWTGILAIVGLILALLGLKPIFFPDEARVSFEIVGEANVVDFHEGINGLTITYAGKDLLKDSLNLKVMRIKVWNSGNVNITKNLYDEDAPFGFSIKDGTILTITPFKYSSNYLSSYFTQNLIPNKNMVEFSKVLLDKGSFVVSDILILHDKSTTPQLIPSGKISGIIDFDVTNMNVNYYWLEKRQLGKLSLDLLYLLFKIAGIGISVSVIHILLRQAGKENDEKKVTLVGIVIVTMMVIGLIRQFYITIKLFVPY